MGADLDFQNLTVFGARKRLEGLLAARTALLLGGPFPVFNDRGQMGVIAT
jgi:hypothetical protein